MKRCLWLFLAPWLCWTGAHDVAAGPPTFAFAYPAEARITVDGDLTEPAWQHAVPVAEFVAFTDNSRPAEVQTTCRVAYDATHLYLAIRADEPAMAAVTIKAVEHDAWPPGSTIEVFIDPKRDRYTYYQLAANLAGSRYDSFRKDKDAWNPDWQAVVKPGDGSWSMEMAIPLKDLSDTPPQKGDVWGLNLCRNREGGLQNSSTWARVGSDFHNPGKFNSLIFGGPRDFLDAELTHGKSVSEMTQRELATASRFAPAVARQLAHADRLRDEFAVKSAAFTPTDLSSFAEIYGQAQSVRKCYDAIAQEMEVLRALSAIQGKEERK